MALMADDADSSVAASGKTTWYRDADSDGYGTTTSSVSTCDKPTALRQATIADRRAW